MKPHARIIIISVHASAVDREKAMKLGCNDFMSKPFDALTLLRKINRVFSEESEVIVN